MATRQRKPSAPPSLLDPSFQYTGHAKTNVQETWRRFGWKEPDREKQAAARAKLNPIH